MNDNYALGVKKMNIDVMRYDWDCFISHKKCRTTRFGDHAKVIPCNRFAHLKDIWWAIKYLIGYYMVHTAWKIQGIKVIFNESNEE